MIQSEGIRFASSGLELVGRYRSPAARSERGGAGVVICHPHPQFGGSMDNNVVGALEEYLGDRGLATLAFNFRGVGGSQGFYDQMRGEVDDVVAALSELARRPEIDAGRVGLAGYSFGGLMAIQGAARLEAEAGLDTQAFAPRAVALVSPMAGSKPWNRMAELRPFFDGGSAKMVVAGTADRFCPLKSAQDLVAEIGMEARLIVVEGADHFWLGREADAAAVAADFFAAALAPA